MMLDDDVWNDKDTDDFLRYLKFDYYIMTYIISFFCMEFVIGYTWVFDIHLLGPKGNETMIIFAFLMISRFTRIVYTFV